VKRGGLIAVSLVLAALAVAASAAAVRLVKVPSSITIDAHHGTHFIGEVRAGAYEPCERRRRVVLYKVVADGPGPDLVVGADTTDVDGNWSIMPQGSAGISLAHFYARVKGRSQKAAGVNYVCSPSRSASIKPGQVAILPD
jgi:hypothetical protein